jgi:hypothetical protein
VGGDEDLLQHVLGVLGGVEHLAAEAEQSAPVALEEDLECAFVATPHERDEAVVALEAKERRTHVKTSAALCVCERRSFH